MSSKVSSSTVKGTSIPPGIGTASSSTKRLSKVNKKKVSGKTASGPTGADQGNTATLLNETESEVDQYMTNRVRVDPSCDDPTDSQEEQIVVHIVPPSSPETLKEALTDQEDEIDYQCHPPEDHDPTDPTSASTSTPGGSVVPFESPSQVSYLEDEEECSEDCEEDEEISSEELGDEEEDLEDEDDDGEDCASDEISEEEVQISSSRKPLPQHRPQLPIVERTYNNKRRGRTPGSTGLSIGTAANAIKRVRGVAGIRSTKCSAVGTGVGAIAKSKSIVSSLRKNRRAFANTNPIFLHNSSSDEEEVEDEEDEEVEDEEDDDELGDEYLERDESDEEEEDGIEPPGFLLSTNRDPSALQNIPPDAQARLEAFFEAAGFTDGKLMSDPESLRKLTLTVSSALGEASAAINRMRDSQRKSIEEGRSDSLEEGDSLLALACSSGYFELARVLLAMGANVDDRGSKGDLTPLMDAASQGHLEIVRLLLSHGADVNAQSACGNSALMYACASGHVSVVEDLLKAGAHVEDNNENGHTPLMEAASAGHVPVAKLLLTHGAGINTHSNEFKESALTVACYKGHLDMVRFLLEAGADQQHKTDEMHTALMEASMDGHVEVARLLLDSGAQVNMPADSFESPLTLAACGGHVELAELLLERGANIEEVNDEGYTPLMEAAREGHLCVVKTLIQHHAVVNAKTEETQETALTLAACGGFLDVVDLLLKAGAEIELGASTPLMEASQEGHIQVVRFLIEKGADIFRENAAHDLALSFAAENGHLEIVQLFVDLGCDPEHLSEGGRSPLMKAARGGHVEVIKYLLGKKADVNRQTTTNDHTPLSMACAGGHLPAVELLLAVGANPYHKLKDNSTMVIEAARGGHTSVIRCLLDYMPPNSKASMTKTQAAAKQGHMTKVAASGQGKAAVDPKMPLQVKSSVLRKCRSTSTLDSTLPPVVTSASGVDDKETVKAQFTDEGKVPPCSNHALPLLPDSEFSLSMDPQTQNRMTTDGKSVTVADGKPLTGKCHELGTGQTTPKPATVTAGKKHPIPPAGMCYDCSKSSTSSLQPTPAPGHVHVKRPAAVDAVATQQHCLQSTSITAGTVMPTSPSAFTPFPSSGPPLVASQVTAATAISERPKLKSKPRKNSQLQSQNQSGSSCQGLNSAGTSPGSTSEKSQILSPVGSPGSPFEQSLQTTNATTPVTSTKGQTIPQVTPSSTGMVQQALSTAGIPVELKDANAKLDSRQLTHIFAQHQQQFIKKGKALFQGQGNLDQTTGNVSAGSTTTTTTTVVVTHGNGETETIFDGENLPPGANEVIMNAAAAAFPIDCFPLPSGIQVGHSGEVHVQSYQVGGSGDSATTTMQTTTIINAATSLNNFQQQILLPHHPPPLPAAIAAAAAAAGLVPATGAPPPGALKGLQKKEAPPVKPATPAVAPPKISGTSAPPGQARIPVNQVPPVSSLAAPVGQKKQLAKRTRPLAQSGSCSRQSNQQTQTHAHAHGHGKQSVASTQTTITGQQVNPNHFDVNHATESSGETSLSIAAASGHYEVVDFLLSRKANIEHRDKKGCTPLILAADSGYDKVVELLLSRGADIEAQSERTKDTALSLACTKGRFEAVEILIKKGANKEHRNVSDYTPLSLAASGGYVNIIKLLLQNGAEINSRTGSKLGISPLMLAAMNGNTAAVKLLLDMGSDINAQIETNKNTALTLACFQGRQEVVSLLLERKANLEHRAKTGLTPLMEAANGGYTEVGKILIDKGADVNAAPVPATKDTALTIAADKGHYRFVELLLSKHAMVEVRNKKGCTPMWLACNGGHLDVAQILFKHRADLDVQDNRKVSCLMTAFRKGHVKLIRWIVKNVQQFPSDAEMLRFYASIQGETELLKKCEQCGDFIKQAKDKQALEANKNASILLEELDQEKSREESKRQAAARRREKKKKKKLEKRQGPAGEQDDDEYDQDDDDDDIINTLDCGIDANSLGSNSSATGKNKENVSSGNPVKVDGSEEPSISAKSRKRRNRKERERQNQLSTTPRSSGTSLPIEMIYESKIPVNFVLPDTKDILREKDNKMTTTEPQAESKTNATAKGKDKKTKRDEFVALQKESTTSFSKVPTSGLVHTSSKKGNKVLPDCSKEMTSQYFEPMVSSSRKIAANFDTTDSSIFSYGYVQQPFAKSASTATGSSGTVKSGRKDDGWKEVTRNFPSSKSKKVIVPSSVISRVIGRGGCNINAIREATGAHIEVEKQQKGQVQLERTIQIKGTVDSTKQAYTLITALMNEPDLDVKKLIPLSAATPIASMPFSTGTFSVPVTTMPAASQRASTNAPVSSTVSPTAFDNTPFSTFVSSSVPSKPKTNKQASPPVTSQISPTVKKGAASTGCDGNAAGMRGTLETSSKVFGQTTKPVLGNAVAAPVISTGFTGTTSEMNPAVTIARTNQQRGSITSNGQVSRGSITPTITSITSVSASGSPVPSSSPGLSHSDETKLVYMSGASANMTQIFTNTMLGSPTNTAVGQSKESAAPLVPTSSPVHGSRNSLIGCSVIGPPGSIRSSSSAENTELLADVAQQSSLALEYSPFNYTFSKAPGWLPGDMPQSASGLNNFGSNASQTMGSPLGSIGSGLIHNPINSSAARAMNFASVAASGISATSLSTATAQMSHAGQQNGSLVGSLATGLTSSVSLSGKGICDALLESDLPKGDASKAPGYRGNTVSSPVLRPLQQQNQIPHSVESNPLSSQFPGVQTSGGILNLGSNQPMVGYGGPGRNPAMNIGGLVPNYGMGGFGQEIGAPGGLSQGGYAANRLNPRAPCFTLPQHSKLGSPTQPAIPSFQQTMPPIHNQQLHNSYKLNNSFGVRTNNMLPGGRQGTTTGLNIPTWNPYGNDSSVVDLQNLAVLAASTGTLDPQLMFAGVDPIVHDNSQHKQLKPDGRLPRPIGGERSWKNTGTNPGAGNLNMAPFGTLDCMDSSQVSPPQGTPQQSLPGQGWMGSVYAPPQFTPVSNQNPNNGILGNHQRVGGGDARNFLGRRFVDEIDPNRIAELQQMIDGQHRMMNGGLPGPPPMHMGGNMQHPGMMFPFGPPMENMEPHLGTKIDQHTNSWDAHFHIEDKHNMGWNSKWGN